MNVPKEMRWGHNDYLACAILGLAYLDAPREPGKKRVTESEAIYLAHLKHFPPDRHETRPQIMRRNRSGRFALIIAEARRIAASGTDAKAAPPTLPPPSTENVMTLTGAELNALDEADGVGRGTRWDQMESSLIARETARRHANDSTAYPPRIVYAVQRELLPVSRRRRYSGIAQQHIGHKLLPMLEAAYNWGRENIPGYMLPGPLPASSKPTEDRQREGAAQASAEPPAPPPVPVLEMVSRKPPSAPPEPAKPTAAPIPPTAPPTASAPALQGPAAKRFATGLASLITDLLEAERAAVRDEMMGVFRAELGQLARAMGMTIAAELRADMNSTLSHALGGPVDAPPPRETPEVQASPQEASPAAPTASHRFVLRADVVGLVGNTAAEVKSTLNGRADLRFIDPDKITEWIPRERAEVFIATRFVPHQANRRCSAFNVKPHFIHGGGSAMVLALERVYHELNPEAVSTT